MRTVLGVGDAAPSVAFGDSSPGNGGAESRFRRGKTILPPLTPYSNGTTTPPNAAKVTRSRDPGTTRSKMPPGRGR